MKDCFNNKTVIILDRHPYFLQSSNHKIDFETFQKNKTSISPIPTIFKSLWTCNVEAVLQYIRIVYDLFPFNKLLYLIVNDQQAISINTSNQKTQNLQHISLSLALKAKDFHNKPQTPQQHNVVNGVLLALKILSESNSQNSLGNNGRVVVLGSFGGDEGVARLEECIGEALKLQNQLVLENSTSIKKVHLVLVEIMPLNFKFSVTPHPSKNINEHLMSEVITSHSGEVINETMVKLVMEHFELVLTTVTGIPMKEEQNVHSSANYDVQLLHSKQAHHELASMSLLPKPSNSQSHSLKVPPTDKNATTQFSLNTPIPLKWCTPKNSNPSELHHCAHAHRATPLDVTSRPSLCLTNFLLAGRSVMLELNNPPSRMISHMLTSHAGEIFIHSLATFRSPIDCPPSISDGKGGRLTDYRVQDFGEVLKMTRLVPRSFINADSQSNDGPAIEKGKELLERLTRYWPLTMNESLIFNMPAVIEPLTTNLVKKNLTEFEVVECLKVIYQVVSMKAKNEPLSIASSLRTGKSNKREDQYRQLWAELERLIRCHSETSPNHQRVLTCLLDFKKPDGNNGNTSNGNNESNNNKSEDTKNFKPNLKVPEILEPSSPNKKFKPFLKLLSTETPKNLSAAYKEFCIGQIKATKFPFAGLAKAVNNRTELYQHLKEKTNTEEEAKNIRNTTNKSGILTNSLKRSYKLTTDSSTDID